MNFNQDHYLKQLQLRIDHTNKTVERMGSLPKLIAELEDLILAFDVIGSDLDLLDDDAVESIGRQLVRDVRHLCDQVNSLGNESMHWRQSVLMQMPVPDSEEDQS